VARRQGRAFEIPIRQSNALGIGNTAVGYYALQANNPTGGTSISGGYNTALGFFALGNNTIGGDNTAIGVGALRNNVSGYDNTATGYRTLYNLTSGHYNTANGYGALYSLQSGGTNTATGIGALYKLTTGGNNTATGANALLLSTTGSGNIALGYDAGNKVTTGSSNIEIGNEGEATDGVAANHGVIRIGTAGSQKKAFIAGIENSQITGSAVYVTTAGQLGVLASSERYKTAIEPMGANTARLGQLRPVTFKLKTDVEGTVQYGLIAEEVDKVYPELVIRNNEGKIQGVRYDELAPMLLNEMQSELQKQQQVNADQTAKIASLEQQVAKVNKLQQRLDAVLQQLKAKDELVAQR
jgi:polyhydroxyalkanoate synthesis regulator phasin